MILNVIMFIGRARLPRIILFIYNIYDFEWHDQGALKEFGGLMRGLQRAYLISNNFFFISTKKNQIISLMNAAHQTFMVEVR